MAIWSRRGRACPFASKRQTLRIPQTSGQEYFYPEPENTGDCGDWCQLFDDETLDCKLVKEE